MYLGDFALNKTFDVKFTTRSFATGAPTTLAGTPVVSAYPDNSVTELTAGITLTVDFDARTGLHNVRVVATGANGYATLTNYALVITVGTVGGVSVVGEVIGHFSIEARSAIRPATVDRTLVVDAAGLVDANTVKVGPTGAGVAQTAGDIMADTNDIQARLPAALVAGRMASNAEVVSDKTGYAIGVGGIASTAFAAAAIDAAALATDATPRIVKNLAIANFMFLMVDSTDHVTPKTGLTWAAGSAQVSIDGAAFANLTNLPVEVSAGIYKINLAAADMNGDALTLKFTGTGADTRLVSLVTQP